jgi:hypothetical protein
MIFPLLSANIADHSFRLKSRPIQVALLFCCAAMVHAFPPQLLAQATERPSLAPSSADDATSVETAPSLKETSNPAGFAFALSFKTSTLGFGSDAAFRVQKHINLRLGVSGFTYRRDVQDGDVTYKAAFRLRSVQTLVDWFPTSGGFHISPGLLLYDGNKVSAHAAIPTGKVMTSGAETFVSNVKDPIVGTAQSKLRSAAPMVLLGIGSLTPRTRHFGFSFDGGVVFQGSPKAAVSLTGSACDVNLKHCHAIANDPNIQSDVASGRATMESDLSILRLYPVVSISTSYRF